MPATPAFVKQSVLARRTCSLEQLIAAREKQATQLEFQAGTGIYPVEDIERMKKSIADLDRRIRLRESGIKAAARGRVLRASDTLRKAG